MSFWSIYRLVWYQFNCCFYATIWTIFSRFRIFCDSFDFWRLFIKLLEIICVFLIHSSIISYLSIQFNCGFYAINWSMISGDFFYQIIGDYLYKYMINLSITLVSTAVFTRLFEQVSVAFRFLRFLWFLMTSADYLSNYWR